MLRHLGEDPAAERIDKAVAIVVAQIQKVGVGNLAVHIGHADVTFGVKPLGLLIVDDLVGLDAGAVVEQLHVADRRYPRVVVVVVDLVRLDQHLSVVGRPRRFRRAWRRRIVGETLRRRRGCHDNAERGGENDPENEREHGYAGGQATPIAARVRAPPQRR